MSLELRRAIFEQLDGVILIDPHSHINPLEPAARNLADLLGYHYYTELAHSSGLPRNRIEEKNLDPREKVGRIVAAMGPLENTIQYSWFIELAQRLFDFQGDRVDSSNWEALYDTAERKMASGIWPQQVLAASNIEAVFLTNEFDDPLEGFDTSVYIPCLRTDDLVFHFTKPEVRERLERASWMAVENLTHLHDALGKLFEHFTSKNARACAISLPPDFAPYPVSQGRAATALSAVLLEGPQAAESHRRALSYYIFWLLADYCHAYGLPFDLMIGVNRGVYEAGVHQGRDLYDSRVSLLQYKQLFNAFPEVTFPVSVLASVTNQELTSYAWIFPNVVTHGHWWYSNTPTFIEHDLAARLEAVPQSKQIGYYSDMYKLEFGLPKFAMYKRILAKVLAERFVHDRGWSEERAVELGRRLLRDNVERIFMQPLRPFNPDLVPPVFVTESPHLSPSIRVSSAIPMAAAAIASTPLASPFDEPTSTEKLGERLDFVMQPGSGDDGDAFKMAPPARRAPVSEFRLEAPPGSEIDLEEALEQSPVEITPDEADEMPVLVDTPEDAAEPHFAFPAFGTPAEAADEIPEYEPDAEFADNSDAAEMEIDADDFVMDAEPQQTHEADIDSEMNGDNGDEPLDLMGGPVDSDQLSAAEEQADSFDADFFRSLDKPATSGNSDGQDETASGSKSNFWSNDDDGDPKSSPSTSHNNDH